MGRHDCLLSTYCIRRHLTAGVQYRPVKPHAGDHCLSSLYLKTQPQGERPPGPRPLHEQVAGPGLFICLTVSPEPPSGTRPPGPVFPWDPFLRIKRPPPLTIIPPDESALVFPGKRFTPLPPFVPGHSLQAFPTWARPPPTPPTPSRTPLHSHPLPPPRPHLRRPPVRSSLCQQEPHNGLGSVFLLKRETGLGERGRSRQLQVPQWGAVKGPPSIRAAAQAGGRGGVGHRGPGGAQEHQAR